MQVGACPGGRRGRLAARPWRRWPVLILSAFLGGCAAYAPRPVEPAIFPTVLDARRVEGPAAGASWTGADLLSAALARNPAIAEGRAKYAAALAAAKAARPAPGPALTLTAEYAREQPHWGYGVAGDFPVEGGARRAPRLRTADLQALQAWYDFGEAAWALRTALARARVDFASARAEVPLAERAVELRRMRLERLEVRVRAGEDARSLAHAGAVELATAEQRLAEARGRLDLAAVALARALGVSAAAVRDVTPATAVAEPGPADLALWRREAALSRRDVLRVIADYDMAENALRAEIAKQYPQVSVGPGYTYDHGVDKLPFNLSLVLPPSDLNRSAIAHAEAARSAAGRTLEAVQADVLAAVDAAIAARAAAKANREPVENRALPAARAAAAAAAHALDAGEGDSVDDLAARAALVDAELGVLAARRAEATAAVDLEDALRRAFDPAETAALQAATPPPPEAKPPTGAFR